MKVSDEVVEVAAIAAHGAEDAYPGWNDLHKDTKKEYRGMARAALEAALTHPSFQSQLRAYVAGEMRGLVPEVQLSDEYDGDEERARKRRHNACVTTTLANIAAYEKE